MYGADYVVARCLIVYLSVPLSVTFTYCAETAKYIIKLIYCEEATSFYFFHTKLYGNIQTEIP